MRVAHQAFVGRWETLEHDDLALDVREYDRGDGRRSLFFVREDDPHFARRAMSRDINKITYRQNQGGSVLFLGMSVEYGLRGKGLGGRLFDYFTDRIDQDPCRRFIGTGLVHKPLIALMMKRAGLQPDSEDFMAEILPTSRFSRQTDVPKLHVVKSLLDPDSQRIVTESDGGRFYEVVPAEAVKAHYPINSPDMTIALHTRYRRPMPLAAAA